MRVLVLWADDRSPNLGVRVLGAGTKALVRRVWPDAEFVFHNYGAASAPVRLGSVTAVGREAVVRRASLREWFASFDLVLDTRAGDSFADIYGLPRHAGMSVAFEFAHRAGVPVVLGPQTIGPFQTRIGRALARRTLATASVVLARDSVSAEAAAALGRPVDLLTTDVVFALDVPDPSGQHDVVLNVSGLLWQPGPHVDHAEYRRTIAAVYDRLVGAGRRVSLLAHVLDSDDPDNDVPAVQEFQATRAPDAEVIIPTSLDETRGVLAGARLAIGSRMHACLNALSVGTPAIPLAYSRKFAPLLDDLGWSHVIDLRTGAATAPDRIEALLSEPQLAGDVATVRQRADVSLTRAVELLSRDLVPGRA